MPGEHAPFKADGNLWQMVTGRTSPKPEVPNPSHAKGSASKRPASKGEAQENEPTSQGGSPRDQPPSKSDSEEIPTIVISEDDLPMQEPTGSSTPKSE